MKEVELKNAVHEWLNDLFVNGVSKVNPKDVFKNYKPLDIGNKKLHKGILSFSLLPVVTCGGHCCTGCYDIRSMRFTSVRRKRYVNTSLAYHNLELLESLIIKQVEQSKSIQFLRVHVGGDMFSQDYVDMWKRISTHLKQTKPLVKIYTYTKTGFAETLKESGINVVRSEYPEGANYGSVEYITGLKEKYNGKLCPATMIKTDYQVCGVTCKLCMVKENIFFKQH